MDCTKRRKRFREVLAGDKCVRPASVFDPISARIAEDLGFEAGLFAGSTASLTIMGAPDHCVIDLTEFAQQAHRICRASNLPLMVDADHGYGNSLSVRRTVQELETAGVAGLSIEDTDLPTPFGKAGTRSLIPMEEGVAKMKAALDGRQDPELVIVARTSAVGLTTPQDAVLRVKAYAATGVDAVFLSDVNSRETLEAIAAEIDLPLMIGKASPEVRDTAYFESLGVRIDQQGHKPILAGMRAIYEALKEFREEESAAGIKYFAPATLVRQLTRADEYDRQMAENLS
ncbi:MAG: isocitrate lyase/PEP mutase family protein [Proteobacteria bacterium]|nr:isocitrate lyase/PEP mutase family protein [Pseudomonadota bacterium]